MNNAIDFLSRILISLIFLTSAYNKIMDLDGSINWMESFGVPGLLIYPAIALEIILPVY